MTARFATVRQVAAKWLGIPLIVLLTGCATLPTDIDRPVSTAIADTDDTLLGRSFQDGKAAHPGQSGFLLLSSGLDAFVARAVLAHKAERSIDAQYYLFHDDLTAALFLDQLIKAADRGVRVRLLVDDMDLAGRELGTAIIDSIPNFELRIFNPFSRNVARLPQFITRFGSVTRRMHNKSFTVDGQATILGGRNIGNEYFEADPDLAFSDLDVLAIGPVADEVSASFDKYWNSELAYPALALKQTPPPAEAIQAGRKWLNDFVGRQADSAYLKALENSDLAKAMRADDMTLHWGDAKVVYDQPEKLLHDFSRTEYHLSPQIAPYFGGVTSELILFSPYFVPGKEGVAFLTDLAKRGVRVRILTNSLASTDVGLVHAGYAKYRKALLRGGVELYEMDKRFTKDQRAEKKGLRGSSKASLHTKSFVFDRQKVFIGSLNLDPRAVDHNTEIGVIFESETVAGAMSDWFDANIDRKAFRLELTDKQNGAEQLLWHGHADGQPVVHTADPYTGFWRRFGIAFMSLLPIESQL
jgi:putative cardiolipin synthase